MRKQIWTSALMMAGLVIGLGEVAQAQNGPPPNLPAWMPSRQAELIRRGVRPDPATLSDAQVMDSVKKGIDFLLADVDRSIKEFQLIEDAERAGKIARRGRTDADQPYGELVLATYALLHVGKQIDDPRLRFNSDQMAPLVRMVTKLDSGQTYTAALQALAIAQLPAKPEYKKPMGVVVNKLMDGIAKDGGYTYPLNRAALMMPVWDNSNSQYGLLGVWAASEWGMETRNAYWSTTEAFWRRVQCPDGGWDYGDGTAASTTSMTAAGVASLFVCQEYVDTNPRLEMKYDKAIDTGITQLINSFDADSPDLYYLYGVERVGLASGVKLFKKRNWYREAASSIISLQRNDGAFQAAFIGATPAVATSYALLFLIRGRAPVVFNKLQYSGQWNARPRDCANLTMSFEHGFEKHINWQIVSVDNPVDDWMDAPILMITGSRDPAFTPEQINHLRQFINAGGIVFSTSDGASPAFTEAIRKIAAKVVFNQYEMRLLPKEHPLFTLDAKFKAAPPSIYGLSNGIRELWIHVPQDYGAAWQARLRSKVDAWDVPTNLYYYASGKSGLRSKLQTLAVPNPPKDPDNKLALARLSFAGNWDPEPGAWGRLGKIMAAQCNTKLTTDEVKLSKLGSSKNIYEIALLTGTGKYKFKDEDAASLRKYVADGGTVLLEAGGGNEDFAASLSELAKMAWPDAALETLPPEHELYTAFVPEAAPVKEIEYRKIWMLTHGASSTPHLGGIKVNGRLAVFFSAEDISSGLLGTNTWGVGGYSAPSAEAIARNIVLWAGRKQAATSVTPAQPTTAPAN